MAEVGAKEEPSTAAALTTTTTMMIDEAYEFSAPRFYDFVKGESEEDVRKAELWFDSALAYAPSRTLNPFFLLILLHNPKRNINGFRFAVQFFLNLLFLLCQFLDSVSVFLVYLYNVGALTFLTLCCLGVYA
jgi:hypothetical protein